MKRVYFDNAATTPIHPRVLEKMLPYLRENYGNPSSIHSFGRNIRVAIEEARETIAEFINVDPSEIYFLSSGTEANNFSFLGIARTEFNESKREHVITTKVEHHCLIDSAEQLSKEGFNVLLLDVEKDTTISEKVLEKNITPETSLVSVIQTNNETGAINNIPELSKITQNTDVFFHSDAVQSFGKIKIDVKQIGIDSLCASAHKINGPKGIGISYVRNGTPMMPMIFGGSQERNRRAGTENVAGIMGFAEAVKISNENMKENEKVVSKLKTFFLDGLRNIDNEHILINGGDNSSPYIVNITFNSNIYNNDAEAMLMFLDINGIAASNGAACTSGTLKPSHVILNSGRSVDDANGSIRFSFGHQNTKDEVEYTLEVLEKLAKKFRK